MDDQKIIPVTPPELRPLVPLDGGRFATSTLTTSIVVLSFVQSFEAFDGGLKS